MQVQWLEVLAIAAVTIPALVTVLTAGYFLKMAYRRWRINRSGIHFVRGMDRVYVPLSYPPVSLYEANRKAETLIDRLMNVPAEATKYGGHGFVVTGGATGHTYRILPRALFPIADLTAGQLLCGKPYNAWSLPMADTMLAQALYLQCPETERAFVALCNKTAAPSVAFTL